MSTPPTTNVGSFSFRDVFEFPTALKPKVTKTLQPDPKASAFAKPLPLESQIQKTKAVTTALTRDVKPVVKDDRPIPPIVLKASLQRPQSEPTERKINQSDLAIQAKPRSKSEVLHDKLEDDGRIFAFDFELDELDSPLPQQ